jgi:hypothetical protein
MPEERRAAWEERAAVMVADGGVPRLRLSAWRGRGSRCCARCRDALNTERPSGQACVHPKAASSACASWRSAVSKPSANQP